MNDQKAKLILDRLNEKTTINYEGLNEQEVINIIIEADKEQDEHEIQTRLAYLRQEIEQERISTSEILELQSLAPYIDKSDTLLLQWAGVPEFED